MTSREISHKGVFYTGKYIALDNGEFFVVGPSHCPKSSAEKKCKIGLHSKSFRKHGPDHPLHIFRCYTHGPTMRVYPVGWVPYARAPLRTGKKSFVSLLELFSKSVGGPIKDVGGWCLRTFYRRVELFRKLLGCQEHDTEEDRLVACEALHVPTMDINELYKKIRDGPDCRKRAEALVSFIFSQQLTTEKLVLCGFRQNCWRKNISS